MITCRFMRRGEPLPWSTFTLGWTAEQLNPDTVFIAEKHGRIIGAVIAAEVHGTLQLIRMLGNGGEWVRPLWRFIRLACLQRSIAGVWMLAQNRNEAEAKLLKLLARVLPNSHMEERDTTMFAGRWGNASFTSGSVACAVVDGSERSGRPGDDGVSATQSAGLEQLSRQPCIAAGGTERGQPESSASGGDRAAGEHAAGDGRQLDTDSLYDDERESRRSAVRLELDHAVFGRQLVGLECSGIGRDDNTEQQWATGQ